MLDEDELDGILSDAGLGPGQGPVPAGAPPTPEQAAALDSWLSSRADEGRAENPAEGEKTALEQVRPEAVPSVKQPAQGPEAVPPAAPIQAAMPPAPVERPNLHPYGLEAPPEVKRDRLGEVASTILGVFAGKDKFARRAALAGGLGTMISAKPGEEVEKENYDRRLHAASKSAAELAAGLRGNQLEKQREYQAALMAKWKADALRGDTNTGIRQQGLQLRQIKQDIETNPDNQAVAALKEQLYQNGVPRGALDGQNLLVMRQNPAYKEQVELFYKQLGIPVAAEQAGATATAGAEGRTGVEIKYAPQTTAIAATKAGEVAKAGQIGTQAGKLQSGVIMNADELLRDAPYVHAKNPGALQSALSGPNATKVIAQMQGYGRSRDVVTKMDHLRQVFRDAVSSGDAVTAYNARRTYESHADEYAAAMGQLAGVASQGTNEHFRSRVPSIANPLVSLDSLYEQIDANAESNLGVYGLEPTRPDLHGPFVSPHATPASQVVPRSRAPRKAQPAPAKNLKPITVDDL